MGLKNMTITKCGVLLTSVCAALAMSGPSHSSNASIDQRKFACLETHMHLVDAEQMSVELQKPSNAKGDALVDFGYISAHMSATESAEIYTERLKYLKRVSDILRCKQLPSSHQQSNS